MKARVITHRKRISYILANLFFLSFITQQASPLAQFKFLEGTWKRENKPIYEKWVLSGDGSLQGKGYTNTEDQISEYVSITIKGTKIIYTAQVPDQNNGEPVEFVLNTEAHTYFSFINPAHDFPKEIRYTPVSPDSIQVHVLGARNDGFSFYMIRQK